MHTLDDFLMRSEEDDLPLFGLPPLLETEQERRARLTLQWQWADRLREALCCVPFYAKRAEAARQEGNEMAYWLALQGSQATLVRKSRSSSGEAIPPPA